MASLLVTDNAATATIEASDDIAEDPTRDNGPQDGASMSGLNLQYGRPCGVSADDPIYPTGEGINELMEHAANLKHGRALKNPPESYYPEISDRFTRVDHAVPWPHLFGLLSTLFNRPDLARLVKQFKITRRAASTAPRSTYNLYGPTTPEAVPGAPTGFAARVHSIIKEHTDHPDDLREWTAGLGGVRFDDAYLAIMAVTLSKNLRSIDFSEAERGY